MVISNKLNGPFRQAHAFTVYLTLIVAINVFFGLASLGCAMAAKMTDSHACLKPLHAGNPQADTCALPSVGGAAMIAMAPGELVSVELAPPSFAANVSQTDRTSFDEA